MKTAYQILDVSTDASDQEIKQAYLTQIKRYPPEQKEQFQSIHQAFLAIKDRKSRLSYQLFNCPEADFNALLDLALDTEEPSKLTAEQFNQLLKIFSDDSSLIFPGP